MLMEGMILGGLTLGAFSVSYGRLPKPIKTFVVKHPLLTDIVCVVCFYKIMGMTLVAHVAVATMSLGMQGLMHLERNKEDYAFLYDAIADSRAKMSNAMDDFRNSMKKKSNSKPQLNIV